MLRQTFNSISDTPEIETGSSLRAVEGSEVVTVYHRPLGSATYSFVVEARPVGSEDESAWRPASELFTHLDLVNTMRATLAMEYRAKFSELNGSAEVVIG